MRVASCELQVASYKLHIYYVVQGVGNTTTKIAAICDTRHAHQQHMSSTKAPETSDTEQVERERILGEFRSGAARDTAEIYSRDEHSCVW